MKRFLFLMGLLVGMAVASARAQQQPSAPPPPPPTVDQAKPRQKLPLTEEQRALAEQRLDAKWSRMTLEGKTQLMRLHRALAEMPPDERKFIHDRIERFLNMTTAERARLQQNRKKWEQMTPEERQRAREEFRNRRQEFEQQWRRNHPGEESQANPLPPAENNGTPTSASAPPAPAPATP
jgi:DNA repair exonuclease SbcCD ATPase subunit